MTSTHWLKKIHNVIFCCWRNATHVGHPKQKVCILQNGDQNCDVPTGAEQNSANVHSVQMHCTCALCCEAQHVCNVSSIKSVRDERKEIETSLSLHNDWQHAISDRSGVRWADRKLDEEGKWFQMTELIYSRKRKKHQNEEACTSPEGEYGVEVKKKNFVAVSTSHFLWGPGPYGVLVLIWCLLVSL